MNLKYAKVGDYFIPNIRFPKQIDEANIGKYGRLRLKYLKENKKAEFIILRMENKLNEHLLEVQNECEKRVKELIIQMANEEKINEKLKENDQLKWAGIMNNFKNIAEEIAINEIIYV